MATGEVFDEFPNHVPFEFVEAGINTGHPNLTKSITLRMRPHTFEGAAQRAISWFAVELLRDN